MKYPNASSKAYLSEENYLLWFNNLIRLNNRRVKRCHNVYDLSDPAGYCILFEKLFPGSTKISELTFNSKSRNEWRKNWRIFKKGALKVGLKFEISTRKLLTESYTDNFHILRWFYEFYHLNATPNLRRESRAAFLNSSSSSSRISRVYSECSRSSKH